MEQENSMDTAKARVLDAALPHAAFDGWSETTLQAAIDDSQTPPALARALFPRGGIDLAVAYHQGGDRALREALAAMDLSETRYTARVALAVKLRLQSADRELVRRGTTLFALPQHAAEGTRLIWATADTIWTALGDTSTDVNWYSKRATLSAVYGATVLFWLGDQSEDSAETWAFLDRRLANVMQFEKTKAALQNNPLAKTLMAGPLKLLKNLRAPNPSPDLPGRTDR
jgi:ubiquinone biosynthesis protein COQ9